MSRRPVERTASTEDADTRKLRTYFQDVDEQTVKILTEKYGHLVPPERLERMANQPTEFETPKDFVRNYRETFGERPEPGVVGYTQPGQPAHVSTEDMAGVPETTVHERLHQMSDEKAPEILGNQRYEGVTEDLALKAAEQEPLPGDRVAYPEERAAANSLRSRVGDVAVDEAYFKGDPTKLSEQLSSILEKDETPRATKPGDLASS